MNNENNDENIYEYFIRISKTIKEKNRLKVIMPGADPDFLSTRS